MCRGVHDLFRFDSEVANGVLNLEMRIKREVEGFALFLIQVCLKKLCKVRNCVKNLCLF